MKKKIFTLLAFFACVLSASAQNSLTVGEALITKGGTGSFDVVLTNPGDAFCAFQMDLTLPDGFTLTSLTKSGRFGAQGLKFSDQGSGLYRIVSQMDDENNPYLGEDGALFSVTVSADASLVAGNKYSAKISNVEFTRKAETTFKPADFTFDLEVTDKVILDENSTEAPTAKAGTGVIVKRTLAANVWNTLCLPFDMTAEQLKTAFGDDVKVAELSGYAYEEDPSDEDYASSITLKFSTVTAITKNKPCVIKVSSALTQFTVSSVDIAPEDPDKLSYSVGKKSTGKAYFYGTFVAGTTIPKDMLFLSGNKFYYSTTSTQKMKGFRGYFESDYNLKDKTVSAPAINIDIDGETTNINDVRGLFEDGAIYDLNGIKIENPTKKGVYIQNGKKVVVK